MFVLLRSTVAGIWLFVLLVSTVAGIRLFVLLGSTVRGIRLFFHRGGLGGFSSSSSPAFGLTPLLPQALCAAVTTGDLAETLALLFCGAAVTCDTGDPRCPTPLALAQRSGQRLQMEFLLHNRTSGMG